LDLAFRYFTLLRFLVNNINEPIEIFVEFLVLQVLRETSSAELSLAG
jgi:hypothetical protein